MKNKKENRLAFIAQYWGQNIGKVNGAFTRLTVNKSCILNIEYLELKPLSAISDEDAIELVKIFERNLNVVLMPHEIDEAKESFSEIYSEHIQIGEMHGNLTVLSFIEAADFLRSKGYLLSFRDISTDDLISFGWAKISDK